MQDWKHLSRPFSKFEIDVVVNHMGSLRALGPDGYQALLYQKNWHMVSRNVYDLGLPVLEGKGYLMIAITHIVLILKVDNPKLGSQWVRFGQDKFRLAGYWLVENPLTQPDLLT